MDVNSLIGLSSLTSANYLTESKQSTQTGNSVFSAILQGAMDNINTTNTLLSNAENEEISFAMGESENTHDLIIALQKASTALQYTVAVRDKFLDAYKEIMNMQI